MGAIYDTESTDVRTKAPPRGHFRVCLEGPSVYAPEKRDGRSYELVGLFSDKPSAVAHAELAQRTSDKPIVAFGLQGEALFRGTPAPTAAGTETTPAETAQTKPTKPAKAR